MLTPRYISYCWHGNQSNKYSMNPRTALVVLLGWARACSVRECIPSLSNLEVLSFDRWKNGIRISLWDFNLRTSVNKNNGNLKLGIRTEFVQTARI